MNIKYNNNLCSSIIFKGNDVKYVEFITGEPSINVNYIIWAKPFTLNIVKGSGVSSVTVKRTNTKVKDVSKNVVINSNETIYYGDTLSVDATATTGYQLNSYTKSITVDGNEEVNITATQILAIPTLTDVATGGSPTARYTTFKVTNHKFFSGYVHYEVYNASSGALISSGYSSTKLAENESTNIVANHISSEGDYNVKVRVESVLNIGETGSGWSDPYLATYTKLTLASPVISDTYVNNALTGCVATINNPNEVPVTVDVKVWSYRDNTLEVDTSFTLEAKSSVNNKLFRYASKMNSSDMKFRASFAAPYYNPSESYVDISYTGPEETTTRV